MRRRPIPMAQNLIDSLESRRLLAAGFQIQLVFESTVTAAVQSVIQQAATRWQQVITGDIPDVGAGAWGAAVDDIRITARVKSIDGAGNGVAQARPLYLRSSGNKLPIAGEIEIDSADIASQTAAGTLFTIVTHEIGHALGFGTVWSQFAGLTSGLGGSNPLFLGANALREYRAISGDTAATGVPLENTGSTGTRDAHWRESILKTELMTGFLGTGLNPLSRVTLGQFQDLGYTVAYAAADAFALGATAGAVAGVVFNDTNRNGVKDATEAGLSGAAVYADKNANGKFDAGEPTASANSSGTYTLGDLAPGSYTIRPVFPSGTIVTAPSAGYHSVTVAAGQTVTGKHFGIASAPVTGGSVTGNVFNDANGNGTKDSGEANRSGVSVYIDANWNNVLDSGEKSTTTDANGNYTLSSIAAGNYALRVVVPSGTTLIAPSATYHSIAITNGGALTARNFAIRTNATQALVSIGGTVFSDTNRNGKLDAGEAGLSGYVIFIDANYNGARDASETYTTTSATGAYSFTGLVAGGYSVNIVPGSSTVLSPSNKLWWVTATAGQAVTGKHFAIAPGAVATGGSVSGNVFNDANGNGTKDSGEANRSGVTVYIDANWNNVLDAGEKSTTTDPNGNYTLSSVAAGSYALRVVVPSGTTLIAPSATYHSVAITNGGALTARNFAIRTNATQALASISGTVFKDTNKNGKLDAGEAGLAGYVIFIDANFNGIRDANEKYTTTSATGAYSFTGLAAGSYSVNIVLVGATIITPSNSLWWTTVTAGQALGGKNYAIA